MRSAVVDARSAAPKNKGSSVGCSPIDSQQSRRLAAITAVGRHLVKRNVRRYVIPPHDLLHVFHIAVGVVVISPTRIVDPLGVQAIEFALVFRRQASTARIAPTAVIS